MHSPKRCMPLYRATTIRHADFLRMAGLPPGTCSGLWLTSHLLGLQLAERLVDQPDLLIGDRLELARRHGQRDNAVRELSRSARALTMGLCSMVALFALRGGEVFLRRLRHRSDECASVPSVQNASGSIPRAAHPL